jgi:hypothetical protein
VGQPEDQFQDKLRKLAGWAPLYNTIQPPIVGDLESDPWGIVDQYGLKGMSVLSAFFDGDFVCHVCTHKAETAELAISHQRQAHHF